jgi:hypothetical protein
MAVSAGFTAPMLGKKLVSTTYRLSSSCALQLASSTEAAGSVLPFVLAYQVWTYHVFQRRVSRSEFQPASPQPGTLPARGGRPQPPKLLPRQPAAGPDRTGSPHRYGGN